MVDKLMVDSSAGRRSFRATINYQQSTINESTINYQLSTINNQPSTLRGRKTPNLVPLPGSLST
jgi:hypothetical protein